MTYGTKWMGIVVVALGVTVWWSALCAQESRQRPTYADVAPIFKQHCLACHTGPQAADGLRLDAYAQIMAGTGKKAVVVPHKPAKSELLLRVRGQKKPRMPANGPPWLSDAQTAVIELWIQAGALEH
jgi:hypothetical protein